MRTKKRSQPRLVPDASLRAVLRPASPPLPESDERLTPGRRGQTEIEHFHRYLMARRFCVGKDVLDVASGEGYGAALLGEVAASVTGVEIDAAVAAHAQAAHGADHVRFVQGDALSLPLADASVDVAVSFETLEHLSDQERFLREVVRVLRPGGLFIVSTPDRLLYTAPADPPNPFHVKELTRSEFGALLARHFPSSSFARQGALIGSALLPEEPGTGVCEVIERLDATTFEISPAPSRAPYMLAFASKGELPDLDASLYVDTGDLLAYDRKLEEARAEIVRLQAAQAARPQSDEVSAHALNLLAAARDDMARRLDGQLARQASLEDARFAAVREAEARAAHATVTAAAREAMARAAEAERDRLAALLAAERETVARLRQDAADADARARVGEALLAEREGRIRALSQEVTRLEVLRGEASARDPVDRRVGELEAQLTQARIALAEVSAEARVAAAERERSAQLQAGMLTAGERREAELRERLDEAERQAALLRDGLAERDSARERAAAVAARLEEADREVAGLRERVKAATVLRDERDELRGELAEAQADAAVLREALADAKEKLAAAEEDTADALERLREVEGRLIVTESQAERWSDTLTDLQAHTAALHEQLRDRDTELEETRQALDRALADLRSREDEWSGREQNALRAQAAAEAERDSALRLLRQQRLVHARLQREHLAAGDVRSGALTLMARRARVLRLLPRPVKRFLKWVLFGREDGR